MTKNPISFWEALSYQLAIKFVATINFLIAVIIDMINAQEQKFSLPTTSTHPAIGIDEFSLYPWDVPSHITLFLLFTKCASSPITPVVWFATVYAQASPFRFKPVPSLSSEFFHTRQLLLALWPGQLRSGHERSLKDHPTWNEAYVIQAVVLIHKCGEVYTVL